MYNVETFFSDFFNAGRTTAKITNTDNGFTAQVEFPGFEKDEIEVLKTYEGFKIVGKSERENAYTKSLTKYYSLPSTLYSIEDAEVELSNGILTFNFKKSEPVKVKISIK